MTMSKFLLTISLALPITLPMRTLLQTIILPVFCAFGTSNAFAASSFPLYFDSPKDFWAAELRVSSRDAAEVFGSPAVSPATTVTSEHTNSGIGHDGDVESLTDSFLAYRAYAERQVQEDKILPFRTIVATFSNLKSRRANVHAAFHLLDTCPYVVVNVAGDYSGNSSTLNLCN
jgi:hypothetical protein